MKKICTLLLFAAQFAMAQSPITLQPFASGFVKPVDIKHCSDSRLFIVEKRGTIQVIDHGVRQPIPFLDITSRVNSSSNEQGLLGFAFSPNFKNDGMFYVNYIHGSGTGFTRISSFHCMPDSLVADTSSEIILLETPQPYVNHNGGNMMFGPDSLLYINLGDGGNGGDPGNNGQNLDTLLAKILRIEVRPGDSIYHIPPSNPFVSTPNARPEIWAYGVRNPWRSSFDRLTGDMWIGDVGQAYYEEIDFQPAASTGGENYGWRCFEGSHRYDTNCATIAKVDPVFDYYHGQFGYSCSVNGGYVYRGSQHRNLFGKYIFSDYCSGAFWMLSKSTTGWNVDTLGVLPYGKNIVSFGEDQYGELYAALIDSGMIVKLTDTTHCAPVAFFTFEDTLNGCYSGPLHAVEGEGLIYEWLFNGVKMMYDSTAVLIPPATGYYQLKVSRSSGCFSITDSVFVTLRDCEVGVAEVRDQDFIVAPNPSNGRMELWFSNSDEKWISVRNVLGEKVQQPIRSNASKTTLTIDSKGVFFVEVCYHGIKSVTKIVVE
ncbi:MAG: PQQ-dependent sugar dehydrogenase [Chitinophagales bacterium]